MNHGSVNRLYFFRVLSKMADSPPEANKAAPVKEKFLKKAERKVCWDARDALWSCIDKAGGQEEPCEAFRQVFLQKCPPSWVTHFDRKFHYEKFKAHLQKEGYQKIDSENIKTDSAAG